MFAKKRMVSIAALVLLAFVCHASTRSNADDDLTTPHAITINATGFPDFDGDGTVGFSDFVIFAGVFGSREGDGRYEVRYDLNGNGEIGFSDFVIFAQNFGKEVPSPVVAIPDANLRAAIEDSLDKTSGAPITEAEMKTLTSLRAWEAGIRDLTGLETATNLTSLSLGDNDITDISPLAGLTNLTYLWVASTNITDISPLSGLTNLRRLFLGYNDITDISVLSGLTNLTELDLNDNNISDLAPLVANTGLGSGDVVTVTENPLNAASKSTHIPALLARGVRVSFTEFILFSPVVAIPDANLRAAIEAALDKTSGAPITEAEMKTLTSLRAWEAGIRDLTGLETATNLTSLSLVDNDITDISPLSDLTKLTSLSLGYNHITDVSPLSDLTKLKTLSLDYNDITDISPLAGLANLTRLFLVDNDITDISPLAGLTNLTYLLVTRTNITDISPLSGLTSLTRLFLGDNDITDISPLAGLTNLTYLWVASTNITDISPLSGLTNLRRLFLGYNDITDISVLSGLTNLTELDLNDNNISDLAPLVANTGLGSGDVVTVTENPLNAASKSTHIPALLARGVRVSFTEFILFAEPQIYNDNVFVLPVTENLAALWTDSGNSPPLRDYAARFYEHFNDEFDFLIFFANVDLDRLEPGAIEGAFYSHVKNDVQGIGLSIYSNSSWGSAGKLQGVVFHPYDDPSSFRGLLLHELMHRWGNFVVPITSFPGGSHWGFSSSGGYLDCLDITDMIDHGGGKFSAPNYFYESSSEQYSPIELYLAGFIPPKDVPDFQVAEDGKWLLDEWGNIVKDDNGYRMFTASGFKKHTIEDIIAEHGPRVPAHSQAQKDFRAAVILLISEDYPATRERLERLSNDVSWFSHAAKDESGPPVTNFYEATGGRGTMTMGGLSQFQRRAGAKKTVPSSFGTPPQPIVDHWE